MERGSLKDQFGKAGFKGSGGQRHDRGRPQYRQSLPEGYLSKGYFDEDGCLWEELVTSAAKEVAQCFGRGLKSHQLRRFYSVVKGAETRLDYTDDWKQINVEVKGLLAFASEAKAKGKVPQAFLEFVERNLQLITKEHQKAFTKGFVPHFQAIVAFHKFLYPKD